METREITHIFNIGSIGRDRSLYHPSQQKKFAKRANKEGLSSENTEVPQRNWCIIDDKCVIYAGSRDTIEEAFETLTVPFDELLIRYPGLEQKDLEKRVEKWSKPWVGRLKLIEIHDIHIG